MKAIAAATERRLAAAEVDLAALARQLLPEPAPDPSDPMTLVAYLTCEELARLEAAFQGAVDGERDGDQAVAAWDDAQRRAVARMLTSVDIKVLERREMVGRVLVRVDRPPQSGRTPLVAYVPDVVHDGLWHVEAVYRGVLPRTMTTAELAGHDPMPWPPGVRT